MSKARVLRVGRSATDTVGWFWPTYGEQYDLIVLDHEPVTDRELEWMETLATRLAPGGVLIWD